MKLYELSGSFGELFDRFDAIENYEPDKNDKGEYVDDDGNVIDSLPALREEMLTAWFDTLSGIEDEFGEKAENVAAYIKSILAEAKELKAEEDKLKARRIVKKHAAERLVDYLMRCMDEIHISKLETTRAVVSIQLNPESLQVDNDISFIGWCQKNGRDDLLEYDLPKVNKNAVKSLLKGGKTIPGCKLVRNRCLRIK